MVTGLATLNTSQFKSPEEIFWMRKPLFRNLRETVPAQEGSLNNHAAILYDDMLEAASSGTAAATIITAGLIKERSTALSMPEDDIDADKPICTLGVDSLVAIETRFWGLK